MPAPTLEHLPTCRLESVIGGLLAVLRSDPVILAGGCTVLGPEGQRQDESPDLPDREALATGVFRVRHDWSLSGAWAEEGGHFYKLMVPIELLHLGLHYVDTARMFSALAGALWPQDPVRAAVVRSMWTDHPEYGVVGQPELSQGASESTPLGSDEYARSTLAVLAVPVEILT